MNNNRNTTVFVAVLLASVFGILLWPKPAPPKQPPAPPKPPAQTVLPGPAWKGKRMPSGTGYSSGSSTNSYQGSLASLTADPTVNDLNTATGPDLTGSPPAQITAIIDMGSDQSIGSVGLTTGWLYDLTRVLEYATSAAPTTWTTISTSAPSAHSGTFSVVSETVGGLGFSARYIRYSVSDNNAPFPTSGRVSIREVDVAVVVDPRSNPKRRGAVNIRKGY